MIDATYGKFVYHEDFLVTAIGDLPEVDVQSATGVTTAILANQVGGVVEIPVAASDDDDVAAVSTNLNYQAEAGNLVGEVRFKIDTATTDMKFFVGFGDSIASGDETSFSATSDTVTIDTMSDGIGILFDNDATTKRLWAVAGDSDAVTVGQVLGARYTAGFIGTGTWHSVRVEVDAGGYNARWYVDGKLVHEYNSTTAPVITPDAELALGFWNYEQGTAYEAEVDYIHAECNRDSDDE